MESGEEAGFRLFGWRPARYVVVGAVCAIANGIIMILGDLAGIHYAPMTFVAFLLVTPLGYALQSHFTFRQEHNWRAFFKFTLGVAASYPVSLLSFALLCSGLGLSMIIAVPIATIIVFLWNYTTAGWAILGKLPRN